MNISIDIAAKDGMTREDVLDAVKKSCEEYVRTEDGKRTYDCNCGAFNYGDFDVYVPNEICKKYGIEKGMHVSEMIGGLDFFEHLVDESQIQRESESEEVLQKSGCILRTSSSMPTFSSIR